MGLFDDVLLCADYDHTMTGTSNDVPQRNLEAIRYFTENGGSFTLNTGRSVPMSRICQGLELCNVPLLLYNGAAAYDNATGKLLFCHNIPLDLKETMRWCLENYPGLTLELQGLKAHYCFQNDEAWLNFKGFKDCAHRLASLEEDFDPFIKFALYLPIQGDTINDMYTMTEEENALIGQAKRHLEAEFGQAIDLFRAAPRILDAQAKGVSKAAAARELKKMLGKKILVCVGDGENDRPMLESADFAFCPSDGVIAPSFPNVCKCDMGAVADVIYHKIPEILKK